MNLEQTIARLIVRKNALPPGSRERELIARELTGLRYSYEDAGPIIEDLDPYEWHAVPLAPTPARQRKVLPFRRTA
jgi:hypothetical protein